MSNHNDAHRIETVAQLRSIVGESNPVTQYKIFDGLEENARAFVERSPFVVLSTSDADGNQDVSPKGDAPGFVAIEDDRTLLIPDRSGNKLVFGLQNLLANPHIAVLFIVPGTTETLRVNGTAELTRAPEILERLSARGKPAQLAIRIRIAECFFHCGKAFLRAQLWKPDTWPQLKRVSFGKILAGRLGGDAGVVETIDKMIDDDYANNL